MTRPLAGAEANTGPVRFLFGRCPQSPCLVREAGHRRHAIMDIGCPGIIRASPR